MKKNNLFLCLLFEFLFALVMPISHAKGKLTFRLKSVERNSLFDKYTFSCSESWYALGWAGSNNGSELIINETITLEAIGRMASNNYSSFVITDSTQVLNSAITSLKFTNVIPLGSNNLPLGNLSGNDSYSVNISSVIYTGFNFNQNISSLCLMIMLKFIDHIEMVQKF